MLEMSTKQKISKSILHEAFNQSKSMRQVAREIGMKHPQILRVTGGNNYNIDTLVKILDGLNLEITIQPKQ